MSAEDVRNFYTEYGEKEWFRLVRDPYHQLEFNTSMYFIKKHLPGEGILLDAGGGPGRYTIELAKMGYDIILLDLTPSLLDIAREQICKANVEERVKQIVAGSIIDLSMFDDDYLDAVMCLGGPLSHLLDKGRREKAINELVRVAKPGAPIFVSVIGRLAVVMNSFVFLWEELKDDPDTYRTYTQTGYYPGGSGFTACHFYLPEELREEFVGKVEVLEMVGLEGMFSTHQRRYNEVFMMGEYNDILWETHMNTCTHPSIVGISEHFMIICRKQY